MNRITAADLLIYLIVGTAAFVTVWPFLYVFSMSISDPREALKQTVWLFPRGLSLDSYKRVFFNPSLWLSYRNTIFYTTVGTVLNVIMGMISAYPLSKRRLFMRKFFVVFLIIPMYFSGGLIPYFVVISKLHLYNTIWVMILPGMLSIWNVILIRTFFKVLPESLQESAVIDGAGEFTILAKIIVPLSKPIIAVVALYSAVGIWNSWFNAMIFLPNTKLQPLQLYLTRVLIFDLASLSSANSGSRAAEFLEKAQMQASVLQLKYAAIIFTSLPIICLYPFLQKYFIKGALVGSLKG